MYVIVTGGSGFLGSHVVEELIGRGHDVGVFDLVPPPEKVARLRGCRFIKGDLSRLESVCEGLAGAHAVCHLGGVGDVYLAAREPYTAALLNAAGTAHVCEASVKNGVRKVAYASTWEVCGEPAYEPIDENHPCKPDHPYNITKYAGELIALSYDSLKGLPVVALRLGTAFGVRMRPNSVFSIFINKALKRETITIQGGGEQSRQFTHARDIARAFCLTIESDIRGEAVNIVSEESISVRQLAEIVIRSLPTRIDYGPARAGDISPARVSSDKAKRLLGWQPQVRFEEGLNEIIEAARAVLAL